ncbi:methylmalonic aciduria and homocystinuria type C protein homolog [Limulus polyphemus]|uniref:Cyanocobalamin reductase (cyanide-eliminating) n=1 Tax=Limulus polyphemus TaxID=6850 RepID=A0ABM1B088_LIMPO|nr:methylmalonic aciduria and homocystinuria type C protein homolog [Limulus polyphemus]
MKKILSLDVAEFSCVLTKKLGTLGLEVHPFKVGWYNSQVKPVFKLPYDDNTVAFLIISTPQMFEKAFKPFVCSSELTGLKDPIDECMMFYLHQATQEFVDFDIDVIHDFELLPNRRPLILMQTVGHVAGVTYYYQRSDLKNDPWDKSQKIYGVCIHPRYGGWFSFRGVLIFKDVLCPDLVKNPPPDVVASDELRIELLERFNFHWQDWSYRDIIPVVDIYSEEQKHYFSTKPKDRKQLLDSMKKNWV